MMLLLLALSIAASFPAHAALTSDAIQFRFLETEGPLNVPCSHKTENGVDWTVRCETTPATEFTVHLVLNYYPKTNEGYPAYELLYWVTTTNRSEHDSISQWFYLNSPKSIAKIQTRLGVMNDVNYLQLLLFPGRVLRTSHCEGEARSNPQSTPLRGRRMGIASLRSQ